MTVGPAAGLPHTHDHYAALRTPVESVDEPLRAAGTGRQWWRTEMSEGPWLVAC